MGVTEQILSWVGINPGDDSDDPSDTDTSDPDNEDTDTDETDDTSTDSDVPEDIEDRLAILEKETDDLNDLTNQQGNAIDTLQSKQTAQQDSIDEIEGQVEKLLGIYDVLVMDVNPLAAEQADYDYEDVEDTNPESPFKIRGLSNPDNDSTSTSPTSTDDAPTPATDQSTSQNTPEDEFQWGPNDSPDTTSHERTSSPEPQAEEPTAPESTALLSHLDESLISELFILEWMDYLHEQVGVAGALSTLSYYEQTQWISTNVRRTLVMYLIGTTAPHDSEPVRDVGTQLTDAVHQTNHKYITHLSENE